jgi:O-antigen/teichoic acid export membrane protein
MTKKTNLLSDETLSKKLIQRWFWLYFFWYLTAPLWYFVRLFISNSPEVSVADFWVMYSIVSLVTFLYTYNDLWLTESLQYFIPRFYLKKEYNNIKTTVWLSLWVQIATWFLIAAWLWFWSDWLAIHYFQSEHSALILKYFCVYFFLNNIFQVLQTIFRSFQRTFETQLIPFIQWVFILLFTIFCFFSWRWNIEWYSLNWILWTAVWILVWFILYKKYRSDIMQWEFKVDRGVLKKYIKYALRSFIWSWIGTLFGQIIQQMVLYYIWAENAWYYSNFLSLFYIWTSLIWPIMGLIFPVVSELIEKKDNYKLWLLYSFFYNYFSVLLLSFSTLLISLWPEISIALFGKQYLTSWILLEITWIFLLFSQLWWFNYSVLAWMWKVRERVYITWIACLLTIISSYILINTLGIYWAWIAFWLSTIYTWWLSLYLLKKEKFSLTFNYKFIIKNIILFIILWLWIYYWKSSIIDVDWNRWFMVVDICLIWVVFYLIVGACNFNILKRLKSEIDNIRK